MLNTKGLRMLSVEKIIFMSHFYYDLFYDECLDIYFL